MALVGAGAPAPMDDGLSIAAESPAAFAGDTLDVEAPMLPEIAHGKSKAMGDAEAPAPGPEEDAAVFNYEGISASPLL